MRESKVEGEVIRHARRRGWQVRKCQWIGIRGAPDRLFMREGSFFFVEFKRPGEKPSPLQRREIARMWKAGIEVYVIDDIEAGCALFD